MCRCSTHTQRSAQQCSTPLAPQGPQHRWARALCLAPWLSLPASAPCRCLLLSTAVLLRCHPLCCLAPRAAPRPRPVRPHLHHASQAWGTIDCLGWLPGLPVVAPLACIPGLPCSVVLQVCSTATCISFASLVGSLLRALSTVHVELMCQLRLYRDLLTPPHGYYQPPVRLIASFPIPPYGNQHVCV